MKRAEEKVHKDQAKVQKEQQFAKAASRLVQMEQEAEEDYANEVTPHPKMTKVPAGQHNTHASAMPEDLSSPLFESEIMESEFLPLAEEDNSNKSKLTDAPPTDAPTDLKRTVVKRKAPAKQAFFWDAVNHFKAPQSTVMAVEKAEEVPKQRKHAQTRQKSMINYCLCKNENRN